MRIGVVICRDLHDASDAVGDQHTSARHPLRARAGVEPHAGHLQELAGVVGLQDQHPPRPPERGGDRVGREAGHRCRVDGGHDPQLRTRRDALPRGRQGDVVEQLEIVDEQNRRATTSTGDRCGVAGSAPPATTRSRSAIRTLHARSVRKRGRSPRRRPRTARAQRPTRRRSSLSAVLLPLRGRPITATCDAARSSVTSLARHVLDTEWRGERHRAPRAIPHRDPPRERRAAEHGGRLRRTSRGDALDRLALPARRVVR